MFIRKPKDITADKDWWRRSSTWEKVATPAQFGCKKRYTTKKNTLGIEYTKFPKDTNWWNLEKMFGAEHIGEAYLTIYLKKGFKILKDSNGLILHKDGTWNCCTVLPYIEYRVRKVTAEATPVYDSPYFYNDGHKYDVTVYLELPLQYMLEDAVRTTVILTRRFFSGIRGALKSLKYIPGDMKRGWDKGWWFRLNEI